METHDIAIAGIGSVAETHAAAIDSIDHATFVAGSCRTESKGRAFANRFDGEWFAETESMLETVDPDVLIVCTPSGAHLEPTLAAAERDIDVLCEKPLEITTDRVDRMIDAVSSANCFLGGIFQRRFAEPVQELARAATEGRFGSLSVANTIIPWWRDDAYYDGAWQGTKALDGGGALMNQSIHGIDATQWIVSKTMEHGRDQNPVAEVMAYTDRLAHDEELMEVEDTGVAAVRYRNGALGQILGSTAMYPGSLRRIQVAGRNGTVELHDDQVAIWEFREETTTDERIRSQFAEGSAESGGAADPDDIDYRLHRRNIEAYLDARSGSATYPLTAQEARKAVAIVEAIYESAEHGKPIEVT